MTEPPVPQPQAPPVCYRHSDRETYISCQRCGNPICPDCMTSAAVGFHCPDCVKEGAKSTRSGRTAYGGLRSSDASLTSRVLVGINIGVWVLIAATGFSDSVWVGRLSLIPDIACTSVDGLGRCDAFQDGVARGAVWQLFTSMFTHVQIVHIGFNMLALWVLGPQLELALGRVRFVALYLLSGLAGSAVVYWFAGEHQATLGASGAIFGLLGALIVIGYKVGGDIQGLIAWVAINFILTFTLPNISWQGHLGGFIGGGVIAALLVYAPKKRRAMWQGAGLAAVAAAIAVAVLLRTAALT